MASYIQKTFSKSASLTSNMESVLLDTFFEDFADGALFLLDEMGKIVKTNSKTEPMLGFRREQILGQNYFKIIKLKDTEGKPIKESQRPGYKALFLFQKQVQPFFCILDKTKEPIQIAIKTHILWHGSPKKSAGIIVHIRPVQRQLDIKEMQSNFFSLAAHQLKTPAGVTKGYLELALRSLSVGKIPSESVRTQIIKAYDANQTLIRAAKDLLNATKIQGGMLQPDIKPFDLNEVLNSKKHAYELWVETKNIDFKIITNLKNGTGALVHTDSGLVSELLDILLHNAFKFVSFGGRITLGITKQSKTFQIIVEDNGPGLGRDTKPKIDKKASNFLDGVSHGLGLKLARQYVLLLKGELKTENAIPHGAKFTLRLPDWQ